MNDTKAEAVCPDCHGRGFRLGGQAASRCPTCGGNSALSTEQPIPDGSYYVGVGHSSTSPVTGSVAGIRAAITPAQDGAEVEALADLLHSIPGDTPEPEREREWEEYIARGVLTSDWLAQRDSARDAAVTAKVAEQIAQTMTAWADEIEPGDQWRNFPVTPGEIRAKRDELIARAAAPTTEGDHREGSDQSKDRQSVSCRPDPDPHLSGAAVSSHLSQQADEDMALYADIERICYGEPNRSTAANAIQDLFVAWLKTHEQQIRSVPRSTCRTE